MSKQSNQRADVKNPNNPAHKAAEDNRSVQLNPNHSATKTGSPESNSDNQQSQQQVTEKK